MSVPGGLRKKMEHWTGNRKKMLLFQVIDEKWVPTII
jgi:hypothetical protein